MNRETKYWLAPRFRRINPKNPNKISYLPVHSTFSLIQEFNIHMDRLRVIFEYLELNMKSIMTFEEYTSDPFNSGSKSKQKKWLLTMQYNISLLKYDC